MDLELNLTELSCCVPLKRQVLTAEETVEFVLSDYCADAGRIISWHTEPAIHTKRVSESGFELAGSVCVTVLYAGMDGDGLRSCRIKVPFAVRQERKEPLAFVEGQAVCESCECRLLNARKILCRCRVAVAAVGYEERLLRFCSELSAPDGMHICQLRRQTDAVFLAGMWEKEFSFMDAVSIHSGTGRGEEVLYSCAAPRVTECRLCGSKVMVKGEMDLFALCRKEEGGCFTAREILPFAQMTDVPRGWEEAEFEADAEIMDHTAALTMEGAGQKVEAQVTVRLTLRAKKPCRETYLSDLYGTDCQTDAETEIMTLAESDRIFTKKQSLRLKAPAGLKPRSVLCARGECGCVETVKEDRGHLLCSNVTVKVLYLDETDTPALAQGSARCELRLETGEGSEFSLEKARVADVTATVGEDGIECRAEVEFAFEHRVLRKVGTVTGVKAEALKEEKERPSVALRRMEEGDTLWQLAKSHRTTVEAIEKANGGSMEKGSFLLIPKART